MDIKRFRKIKPAPPPLTGEPFTSSVYFGTQKRTPGYGEPNMWGNWDADVPNKFFNWLEPIFGDDLRVAEGFMGSGTTSDLCCVRDIPYSGCDLRPAPRKPREGEHWETDILDFTPDFDPNCIVCHDPYYNMVPYSEKVWGNGRGDPRDISLSSREYKEFLDLINQAHANLWTHLVPGGYMLVMTGIIRKQGIIKVLADDMMKFGTQVARIIKVQKNARSQIKYNNGGYGYNNGLITTDHEEILIWRKEDRFFVVVSVTKYLNVDIRTGKNITWARVAAEAIRASGKKCCTIEEIKNIAKDMFPAKCNEQTCKTWYKSLQRGIYESKLFKNYGYDRWGLVDCITDIAA